MHNISSIQSICCMASAPLEWIGRENWVEPNNHESNLLLYNLWNMPFCEAFNFRSCY